MILQALHQQKQGAHVCVQCEFPQIFPDISWQAVDGDPTRAQYASRKAPAQLRNGLAATGWAPKNPISLAPDVGWACPGRTGQFP